MNNAVDQAIEAILESMEGEKDDMNGRLAAKAAKLLVERLTSDLETIQPFVDEIAVELRCIDAATIPLQQAMQRMVGGSFGEPGVESNIIVLLASSSRTGRHLEKLARRLRLKERKLVCFYTLFSIDGRREPWVLRDGVPMPLAKIVDAAVNAKIVPTVLDELVRVNIKWGYGPEGGLVALVPAAMSINDFRRSIPKGSDMNPSITFLDAPDENDGNAPPPVWPFPPHTPSTPTSSPSN